MFRDVPKCSGMFHVPGFIDARLDFPSPPLSGPGSPRMPLTMFNRAKRQ